MLCRLRFFSSSQTDCIKAQASLEGWMANDIALGGHLTTTTDVENLPGFPEGIDIVDKFRKQSERLGTENFKETVTKVDFSSRLFKLFADSRTVLADAVIFSTGAVAKRLSFAGSGEGAGGFRWNKKQILVFLNTTF